ncbi:MAG TPA: Ig-like domain repeat protein [Terriglobales bacterium]|nr:Ig-like domain repeat protein [Terriglobales bacterium]
MPSPLAQRLLGPAAVLSLFFAVPPSGVRAQTSASQNRITQAVDANKLTLLKGNTHPLARPEFDRGEAPATLRMERMLLVLSHSPQQEAALENLLEQQQSKSSPDYHKWLTADEFGTEFGPSEQDIQTVVAWLQANGFQIGGVSRGGGTIEFSGTAGQVAAAFHTTIHSYVVKGEQHWANSTDPQIPSALAPVVVGVDSLNNFLKPAFHHVAGVFSRSKENGRLTNANAPAATSNPTPLDTFACGSNPNTGQTFFCNGVTPFDFATIYNVLPLWNAATPIDGTGQSIAIVARSNINLQDVANFRSLFGLPADAPQVILDGPDPGLIPGDETEADLDVEWSGGVAKGATIKLVVSESTESTDGVDLSAEYIVDNDLAPIMSESFGECELFLGTSGNEFYKNLWEQAAAEGISVFVSSGDQDSAGCDFFQGTIPQPATHGLEVSGLASTPYNVAVGGTDFNDFFTELTYWNTTNNPTTQQSVKGYVPETTWNDTCTNAIFGNPQIGFSTNAETNCNNSQLSGFVETFGGSGGTSHCTTPSGTSPSGCAGGYLKPAWQTGAGVPSDNKRDLPDVSLFAADGLLDNFYLMCEADAGGGCSSAGSFLGVGGTSAASPAFAGLMALVNQKMGTPQGDPNFILYKLAATQSASSCNSTSSTGPASTCIFNDVTMGTIAPPCSTSTIDCKTATAGDQFGILSGFNAATAYDEATGLGTVNANNLVTNWGNVKFTSSMTALTLNSGNAVNVTHGSPINVNVAVTPTSPKIPTGDVSLIATQGNNTFGFDTMTLSGGTASSTTNMLPGGTSYTVQAHYEGDGTYGGSYSTPVTVTVNPEASTTALRLETFDPTTGRLLNPNASTVTYGSLYLLRADVTNSSGTSCFNAATGTKTYACPTGTVGLTDNGNALDAGQFGLNAQGYTEDQTAQLTGGSHTLAANYRGDNSYDASSTSEAVTVTPAPTTTNISAPPQIVIGTATAISAEATAQSNGIVPTGTFSFSEGSTALSGSVSTNGSAVPSQDAVFLNGTIIATLSAPSGLQTFAAKYAGDTNYASSTSSGTTVDVVYPTTTTISASPSSIIFGQGTSVTVTATLSTGQPTSTAPKPTGTISLSTGGLGTITLGTTNASQDSNGDWILQSTATIAGLPQTDEVGAFYGGDTNYAASNGSAQVIVTIPDFSISAGATPLVITAGQSGTQTLTINPLSSNSSTVQLSCGPNFNIPGATCSVSPASVTLSNGAPATAAVTITTLAPSGTTSAVLAPVRRGPRNAPLFGRERWWTLSLLAGVAALLLILLPRTSKNSLRAGYVFGLVCLISFVIGCGGGASAINSGGGGNTGGGGNNSNPVATTTVLSTASTKVAQSAGLTLTATVTSSKSPTGFVTLNSANCLVADSSAIQNGAAQFVFVPNAPLPVGTCTFTASYGGDANNLPSHSGSLNIATTGTTQLQVVGQTSTLSHAAPVTITIQ